MTRKELVARVREGIEEQISERLAAEILERSLREIAGAIERDGKITLPGFGSFTVRRTAARMGRNPQTGEVIEIAAATTVGFKPAAELRERLGD